MQSRSLEFNHIKHTVTYKSHVLSLNPLSFKLLKALADSEEGVLSVNTISLQVWQNPSVSLDTLKQRVFVLRKSITEAGIDGLFIQSVRGEGYRLIIEDEAQNKPSVNTLNEERIHDGASGKYKKLALAAIVVLSIIIILVGSIFIFKSASSNVYVNNRVALWTNVKQIEMPKAAATIYANWQKMLLNENADSKIHLVLSDRQEDLLVPIQARRDRIALISYFEVFDSSEKTIVNLSIIEPKTATILRSSSIQVMPSMNVDEILKSHLGGILKLISSGKLNLTKEHKENPKNRIWPHLKELANQT